ncbi:MAG: hypothetical protein IKY98_04340 [Alphaproteobacteria bacterium]|nr:hypothetical protein [Alphaproteobacteria bacterium]
MATKNLKNNNILFTNTNADAYSNHSTGFRIKSKMTGMESGRSMVEMLGVLAIVGVLSIGGIMGYSYAMDKYRANIIINEINLRTIDLIRQGHQKQELSLNDWEPLSTEYEIKEIGWTTDNYIYIDIDGFSKQVCKMVHDSFIQQNHIIQIDINAVKAMTNELCSDNNLITLYLDTSTNRPSCWGGNCFDGGLNDETLACSTNDDCPECLACTGGICSGWESNVACGDGTGLCHRGACAYDTCQSNDDCEEDEYCANNAGDYSSTSKPYKCKKINFTTISITLDDGSTETWYASKDLIPWWDGVTICNKLHASLPSPDMLVNNFKETYDNNALTQTDRLKKLFEKTNFDRLWSNFTYPKEVKNCECTAMSVGLGGKVNSNFKNNGRWVICK